MNIFKRRPKSERTLDPELAHVREDWAVMQRRLEVLAQTADTYQRQGGSESGSTKPD